MSLDDGRFFTLHIDLAQVVNCIRIVIAVIMLTIIGETRMALNHSINSWVARLLIIISLLATLSQLVSATPFGHCSDMTDQSMMLNHAVSDMSFSLMSSTPSDQHCNDDTMNQSQCSDQQCQCSQIAMIQMLVVTISNTRPSFLPAANSGALSYILTLLPRPPQALI